MIPGAMKLPTWYRALAVVVGILCIVSALIVLADPLLAVWLLIFLLGFALLVMGIDRLVAGVTGHPFGTWIPFAPPAGGAMTPGASPPTPPSGPNPPTKP